MRAVVLLCALVGGVGCGATFDGRVRAIHAGGAEFRVGPLPPAWTQTRLHGARIAFHHTRGGTISAGADCSYGGDVALDVLTSHLLIGFAARQIESREAKTIDGRAALLTSAKAELDGVPVALELLVLLKDGCLFDLQLVSGAEVFAERRVDFTAFANAFRVVATP